MYKPMLAKQFHKHRDKIKFPVMVQPKIDGLRMLWDGEHVASRTGKDSLHVPPAVLAELEANWRGFPLDGELYCPDLSFEALSGALRRHEPSPELDLIKYWVFDTPAAEHRSFNVRYDMLHTEFNRQFDRWIGEVFDSPRASYSLALISTWKATSFDEIDGMQADCLAQGYEGVMVRDPLSPYEHKRTAALLKYKVVETMRCRIVGFQEGTGKHKGRLGALLLEGPEGLKCKVGTGFSDEQREDIWSHRDWHIGEFVVVEYQEKTKYGVPRFPRYKGISL